jgi:hypothetical protein
LIPAAFLLVLVIIERTQIYSREDNNNNWYDALFGTKFYISSWGFAVSTFAIAFALFLQFPLGNQLFVFVEKARLGWKCDSSRAAGTLSTCCRWPALFCLKTLQYNRQLTPADPDYVSPLSLHLVQAIQHFLCFQQEIPAFRVRQLNLIRKFCW